MVTLWGPLDRHDGDAFCMCSRPHQVQCVPLKLDRCAAAGKRWRGRAALTAATMAAAAGCVGGWMLPQRLRPWFALQHVWHRCVCVMGRMYFLLLPRLLAFTWQAGTHSCRVGAASILAAQPGAGWLPGRRAWRSGSILWSCKLWCHWQPCWLAVRTQAARIGWAQRQECAYTAQPPKPVNAAKAAGGSQLCCMQVAHSTAATARWHQ